MTDVTTPFADGLPSDQRRRPTAEEKSLGFPCGDADITLFNGFFHMLMREMKVLADEAGVSGSDADYNLLRDSIQALISAATGGGDTSNFVLFTQARARLPIHFEVISADGKVNISSPAAGTVRVPGGVSFIHRGIHQFSSAETDFATVANSTYHVRWNPTDGFNIQDLSDNVTYNPFVDAETDSGFDGTYDDALLARVVTNASNISTITNLVNRNRLVSETEYDEELDNTNNVFTAITGSDVTLDWSRTPDIKTLSLSGVQAYRSQPTDEYLAQFGTIGALMMRQTTATRYGSPEVEFVYDDDSGTDGRVYFNRTFSAIG